MKKVLKVTLLIVMCLLLASTVVKAAEETLTAEGLKTYIKSKVNISGHETQLDAIITEDRFTADELAILKADFDKAVALIEEAEEYDIDLAEVEALLIEKAINTASKVGLTLVVDAEGNFVLSDAEGKILSGNIEAFEDIELGETPAAEEDKPIDVLQPTGSSVLPVLGLVAIIAGAAFVVVKKVSVSAN